MCLFSTYFFLDFLKIKVDLNMIAIRTVNLKALLELEFLQLAQDSKWPLVFISNLWGQMLINFYHSLFLLYLQFNLKYGDQ